jgi:hypothetical protein
MNTYGQLSDMGGSLMNEYQNMFEPEYKQLNTDANNYASQARIQQAMGAAESGVAQDFNGQRNAALSDLQEYGIDPSSGRYDQLDKTERVQQAAAQAGAGFQAEQATEATGRGLRSEALQLGSVMPSQATAAYNAAATAATAGENATLANSQEGVNMMGSPTQWGSLGQEYKMASSGTSSPGGSNSSGSSEQPSNGLNGDNGGGPGGGPGRGPGGGPGGYNPNPTGEGGPGGVPNAGIQPVADTGGGNDPNQGDTYQGDDGYDPTSDTYAGMDQDPSGGTDIGDDGSSYDDSGYAGGGAIPYSKSPSRGRVTDDVPAKIKQTGEHAWLNAGEHVMTRAAVKMKGKKFFDDLNAQAKRGAIPTERTHV